MYFRIHPPYSWTSGGRGCFPSVDLVVASVSLLPNGALPKLFPTASLPSTLSNFRIALSQQSSPQAISHGFPSDDFVVASISLLLTEGPNVFPTVSPSVHPVVASISLLPNETPPQAVSHGFLSVHPVVASLSRLPNGTLPKLFPTASSPCTLSSLLSRSLPTELSLRYFRRPPCRRPVPPRSTLPSLPSRSFPTELSPSYVPRLPLRPPCRRFHLASFPRSSAHKLFPTASPPSTLSSCRSFPTELSPTYFPHGFTSVLPLVACASRPRSKCN